MVSLGVRKVPLLKGKIMDANKSFTSIGLKLAREDAKKLKVKIPKLSTWCDRAGTNPYYEVFAGDDGQIWMGNAYDANEAKSNAIFKIIRLAGHEDY